MEQDPKTPKYQTDTGLLTDYGKSLNLPEVNNVITADSLNSTATPFNLPENKPLTGNTYTLADSTSPELKLEREKINAEQKSQESGLASVIREMGITQGKEAGYTSELGAEKAQQDYDRYASELELEQRNLELKKREIQKSGLTTGQSASEIASLSRESEQRQADIAILGNASLKRYDTALSIAKRKVESELAPLQADLDAKKYIFENNKELFNTAELSKLDSLIKKDEKKIADEDKRLNTIESIKIESFKNGFKGDFSKVKTVDEALNLAGSYLMSPKEKLELQKLGQEIEKNTIELLSARETLGGTTGDPIVDIIAGSAKYGDKRLTDSQLEKIQKATQALGTMESLQALLSQGGVKTTGPITGRTRTLLSQLGGDADAKAINATIQGLIPTVARGIFGEVGVLTDADIDNYKKTVPNLTGTEDQNKLVSIIMYDVLSRSIASTLTSNAQNQTNVSNFVSTYNDINNRIRQLKSELGVVDEVPESPAVKAYLDNQVNSGIINKINSGVSSYSSQFTRKQ